MADINSDTIYDVAIIGGGPAGYTAAIRGAEYGLKVALIEASPSAGRHLPARGLHSHQGAAVQRRDLGPPEARGGVLGIAGIGTPQLDWAAVQKRKNAIITKHIKGLEFLMKKNKVTVIAGLRAADRARQRTACTPWNVRRPTARSQRGEGEEHDSGDGLRGARCCRPEARRPHPHQHRNSVAARNRQSR